MAQFIRPVSDIDDGSWASTPFFSKIDEDIGGGGDDTTIASDAVGNNVNTTDLDLEGTNSGLSDPAVSTGHILRVLWASSQSRDMTGHFELWQGVPDVGTLIAEATVELVDTTEVETAYTLTGTEADNITDYNDLHFALWGRGTGGGPARTLVVDAAEFEIPDAGAAPIDLTLLSSTVFYSPQLDGTIDLTNLSSTVFHSPTLDGTIDLTILSGTTFPSIQLDGVIDLDQGHISAS